MLAQQTFGGHGYIVEHGMEQIVRDVRISQIYEGANGIQALDFVARKVLRDGGAALDALLAEIRTEIGSDEFAAPLASAVHAVQGSMRHLIEGAAADPDLPGAASADFLELTGLVVFAWLWAKMARLVPPDHPKREGGAFLLRQAAAENARPRTNHRRRQRQRDGPARGHVLGTAAGPANQRQWRSHPQRSHPLSASRRSPAPSARHC